VKKATYKKAHICHTCVQLLE